MLLNYQEVKSDKATLGASQPETLITITGNSAFKELVGFIMLILKEDGTPFAGNATVSMTTSTGMVILPPQPYHCIRPSFNEKPADRIINLDKVKGYDQDFRFRIDAGNVNEALQAHVVSYFTRK